jgi:hypothetical protein
MTKIRFSMQSKSRQQQEPNMLGDPLPYPARRTRTNIQQLPFEGHAAPSPTVMLYVKAKGGAIVYQDYDVAIPVPEDEFIPVELTGTIVQAIKDGDLEQQGKPFVDEEGQQQARGTRKSGRPRSHAPESSS